MTVMINTVTIMLSIGTLFRPCYTDPSGVLAILVSWTCYNHCEPVLC